MVYIDQDTRIVGLLGYPLEHSLSPLMHNTAFQSMKLNFVYIPLPVTPGKLRDAVVGIKALNFVGANVTIPHKEEILPFLDFVTEEAKMVGAVNTLFWTDDGYLVGDNTDVEGFKRTIKDFGIDIQGRTVIIMGSGGAARAVAVSLARLGAKEIIFMARRQEQVYRITQEMTALFPQIVWSSHIRNTAMFASDLGRTYLLVNASPVGMYPRIDDSPLTQQLLALLPPGSHVYDLVYNPPETKLLKLSRELQNLKIHSGLEMLVNQGAVGFERWTGKSPPVAVMQNALKRHIAHFQNRLPALPDPYQDTERSFQQEMEQLAPASPPDPPPKKGKGFDATI